MLKALPHFSLAFDPLCKQSAFLPTLEQLGRQHVDEGLAVREQDSPRKWKKTHWLVGELKLGSREKKVGDVRSQIKEDLLRDINRHLRDP